MSGAPPDDPGELATLLRASAGGDREAFASLYRHTSSKLFGICLRMLHDRGEAEDVLQDVYITIWRRAGSFDPARAAAMTWLITLTRNRCIDQLRRHREARMLDNSLIEHFADPAPGPSAHGEASEQRRRLEHCLDGLGQQQNAAVRAAFFTGVTYNELAERCGVPLATMKSWIRRSLISLRHCLES